MRMERKWRRRGGRDDVHRGAPGTRPVEGRQDAGGTYGYAIAGGHNEWLISSLLTGLHSSHPRPGALTLPLIARHVVP